MIIDDVQDAKPLIMRELIAHEAQGPSLHCPFRYLWLDAIALEQLAALRDANLRAGSV